MAAYLCSPYDSAEIHLAFSTDTDIRKLGYCGPRSEYLRILYQILGILAPTSSPRSYASTASTTTTAEAKHRLAGPIVADRRKFPRVCCGWPTDDADSISRHILDAGLTGFHTCGC